ncbi:hypothetical protein Purlil1_4623 [Purpureocillium lilacinum]|uniref:Sulphur transport domain-containing protein n=1 Tax=Purpureocillium lilacinum TaxID=33203 RepID=A0ABR0C501_PURLI|nr:hypothetical protein Purlil1_4623 [Purpureocillium lilacinum]
MKRENDYTRQRVAVECYSLTSDRQRDDVPAASQRHGASTGTAGQAAPDGDLQWADSSGHGPAYKGAPRQSARLPTAPAPQDSGTSAAAARRTLRLSTRPLTMSVFTTCRVCVGSARAKGVREAGANGADAGRLHPWTDPTEPPMRMAGTREPNAHGLFSVCLVHRPPSLGDPSACPQARRPGICMQVPAARSNGDPAQHVASSHKEQRRALAHGDWGSGVPGPGRAVGACVRACVRAQQWKERKDESATMCAEIASSCDVTAKRPCAGGDYTPCGVRIALPGSGHIPATDLTVSVTDSGAVHPPTTTAAPVPGQAVEAGTHAMPLTIPPPPKNLELGRRLPPPPRPNRLRCLPSRGAHPGADSATTPWRIAGAVAIGRSLRGLPSLPLALSALRGHIMARRPASIHSRSPGRGRSAWARPTPRSVLQGRGAHEATKVVKPHVLPLVGGKPRNGFKTLLVPPVLGPPEFGQSGTSQTRREEIKRSSSTVRAIPPTAMATTTLVSGVAFGAAMVAAGFANPAVVVSQMKFESWHMFQAFLAATASSAVIYSIAEKLGYVKIQPRSSSPLGLFSRYDGNVLGGALLGAGMALSGSCPGTLYAQLATGVRTGFFALAGALAGGVLWTGYLAPLVKRRREDGAIKPESGVISEMLGLSRAATLVLLEAACVAVVVATAGGVKSTTGGALIPAGAVGGLLIGLAQLVSLVTRRTMVGISGSFEDAGNHFWWLVRDGAAAEKRPRTYQNMLFAAGAGVGAWAIARALPDSVVFGAVAGPLLEVPPLRAVLGGVLMGVGSRLAGGCTSGHGISGMSLLSASSVVTIASTFGAGALVATLIY